MRGRWNGSDQLRFVVLVTENAIDERAGKSSAREEIVADESNNFSAHIDICVGGGHILRRRKRRDEIEISLRVVPRRLVVAGVERGSYVGQPDLVGVGAQFGTGSGLQDRVDGCRFFREQPEIVIPAQ